MSTDPEEDHSMATQTGRRTQIVTAPIRDREAARARERELTDLLRGDPVLPSVDRTARALLAAAGVPTWARGFRVRGTLPNWRHPLRRQWVVEATEWKGHA